MQCFLKTPMRNVFFEKVEEVHFDKNHSYTLAINKMDSRTYALERVQNPPQTYVQQTYSQCIHPYFLHYYTCWAQTETVTKEKLKQEKRQSILHKKKSLNTFLSRKGKNDEILGTKKNIQNDQVQRKHEAEKKQEEKEDINVVYIQLQAFKSVEPPKSIEEIKIFMGVIYLLARQIHKQLQIWPDMIPVVNDLGKFKFTKRGKSRDFELKKLFMFSLKNIQGNVEMWSKEMQQIYEMYELNGNLNILGDKIHEDLDQIIHNKYEIKIKNEGEFEEETAYLQQMDTLVLQNSEFELPLQQFNIEYSYKNEELRQVVLCHELFDEVVLLGRKGNFLIKYFKALKIN